MAYPTYEYQIREIELKNGEKWFAVYEKSLSRKTLFPSWELHTLMWQYDLFKTREQAEEKKKWLENIRDWNPIVSSKVV